MDTKGYVWVHVLLEFDYLTGEVKPVKKYSTLPNESKKKTKPVEEKVTEPVVVGEVEL